MTANERKRKERTQQQREKPRDIASEREARGREEMVDREATYTHDEERSDTVRFE